MIGDDLTPFLLPAPGPDVGFRQGVVQSFDSATGANTVLVAGALLTDLELLNIGDTINLVAGDVVVLMRWKSSWAIFGRVLPVGSAGLSASAVATKVTGGYDGNFALSTSLTARASNPSVVPTWATKFSVLVTASATVQNTSGAARLVSMRATSTLSVGELSRVTIPNGSYGSLTASTIRSLAFAAGTQPLADCAAEIAADAAMPAAAGTSIVTNALVVFTRQ